MANALDQLACRPWPVSRIDTLISSAITGPSVFFIVCCCEFVASGKIQTSNVAVPVIPRQTD